MRKRREKNFIYVGRDVIQKSGAKNGKKNCEDFVAFRCKKWVPLILFVFKNNFFFNNLQSKNMGKEQKWENWMRGEGT